MLIKKIEITNFRQFKGTSIINFACDSEKNITMIMGENGGGKTTLAQAFLWVLYGQTQFKDTRVINKKVTEELSIGDDTYTRVDLIIEEEGNEFTVTRQQKFTKKTSKIDEGQAKLQITRKVNGQIKFLEESESEYLIKNMLPFELSKFFFFDGERIKVMSDEIQKGKSKEFANAVRNLVGLNAIMNSIEHVKESRSNATVIGRYNKKIDESGSSEILTINREMDKFEQLIENAKKSCVTYEENIAYYQKESVRLEEEILSYAPAEKMKREYDHLTVGIRQLEKEKSEAIKKYFSYFNDQGMSFFLKPAIESSIVELKETDKIDKGIPHVHAETIKYLIKKGVCMCGNPIEPGSDESIALTKLLDYLPPKAIGTLINQNVRKSEMHKKSSNNFFEYIENHFSLVRRIEQELKEKIEKQTNLYNKIVDLSSLNEKKVKKVDYDKKLRENRELLTNANIGIGTYNQRLESLKTKKNSLINIDKSNRKYQLYRAYAREIFDVLSKDYKVSEDFTRNELEVKINRIFQEIYEGGLSIGLDENYNIKISVNELEDQIEDVERSTAQNYSVIFAFIAGIIEMAKDRSQEDNSGIFDNAVGYPLVMDAPLSAFDKKRISNICDTLPGIAQQVIFFIKDTDGDVAEEHLGDRVGTKYLISKESEIISTIKER